MNIKHLSIFALSVLLVFTLLSFASAASLTITPINNPTSAPSTAGTVDITFNVSNTGADSIVNFTNTQTSGTYTVTFIPVSPVQILNGQTEPMIARISFSQQSGPLSGIISADDITGTGDTKNLSFNIALTGNSQLSLTKIQDLKLNQNGTFTVTNTGSTALGQITFSASPSGAISFLPSTLSSLSAGSPSTPISLFVTDASRLVFGQNTVTVTATSGTSTANLDFVVTKTFCSNGPVGGNLSITDVTVRNTGDEDETWEPLDTITVRVDVDNNGLGNVRNVQLKMGLFDSQGRNKVNSLEFSNSDEETLTLGTINDGGTERGEYEFVIPADFDESQYKLVFKAYSTSSGVGESRECTDTTQSYESIDVQKQSDLGKIIAITDFTVPAQNICGADVAGSFDIVNVGSSDDDQDQVLVRMRSPDLGIDQEFELRENLDEGDRHTFNFDIPLPTNLKDGSYPVYFRSSYEYRNGAYHESSDSETEEVIKVIGCSGSGSGSGSGNAAAITATLGSDAKAGSPLVVNAVIRNLGTTQQTFVIDASGYQSWASLDSLSDRVITLAGGESRSVAVTLNVNKDATGSQEFTLQATANGKTTTQDVAVTLPVSSSGFSLPGSGLLWVIGLINVILIVLIIVVAVRVSRR